MVAACPFPSPQGSQVFVAQMSEQLAARGHRVHLLTYGQGQVVTGSGFRHWRIRRLPGDDASRSGPTLVKPLLDGLLAAALDRLVRRERIEVIHAHNYEAAAVAILVGRWRGVPVVYHSHNLMGDELPTYFASRGFKRAASWAGRLLDAQIPRRADHCIALCDYSAGILRGSGVAGERLSVIPPAVDTGAPGPTRAQARRRFGIDASTEVIGYCGNLDRYQNLELLVAAVAKLQQVRGDRNSMLLVATHADDAGFASLLRTHGLGSKARVVVARVYADARAAMAASDVLMLPRRLGSGFPIKLLNYLEIGRPVVSAGCGAKVLEHGAECLAVDDEDAAGAAAALAAVLDDPALGARLAEGGHRRFLAAMTWEAVLPAIESIYDRVSDRAGAPKSARLKGAA